MTSGLPAEIFPPGDFLREELEARDWTAAHLATLLGCSPQLVEAVLAGQCGISPETARGLARALGTSPDLWLNLDAAYQGARHSAAAPVPVPPASPAAPRRRAR
jgi:HTH-type transcriptional regulator/antitoxin HigA